MRANEVGHKTFLFFLNALLVIGAILSIVTIDRGRWLTFYLTFFSSGEVLNNHTQIQNIDPYERMEPREKATSHGQGACVVISQLLNPDWYDTYLLVNAYNKSGNGGNRPAGGAEKQVACAK